MTDEHVGVPLALDYFEFRRGEHWASELLTEGPMLVRSRQAGRWHRPRSARRWLRDGRVSWSYWCGQTSSAVIGADALPAGDQACGTCEGRAVGAGFPSSVFPGAPVLFQPRIGGTTPDTCPGKYQFEPLNKRQSIGRCRWCGATERVTGGSYGAYKWSPVRLAPHAPENLIDPCPNHGWLSMKYVEHQLVCECRTIIVESEPHV